MQKMKHLVKICGMSHVASIEAAVAAGVDALGFVFTESPRMVTPRHAAFIGSRVPRHVLRVAVTRHPTTELWQEIETIFCPDVLQTDQQDFEYLDVPPEIIRWPVIREGAWPGDGDLPEVFVYEGASSGVGERVDWRGAAALAGKGRMILAGGLDSSNVAEAIRSVGPWGVDVSSSVESAPGVKDADLIHEFVAAVRMTEALDQEHGAGLRNLVEDATREPPK